MYPINSVAQFLMEIVFVYLIQKTSGISADASMIQSLRESINFRFSHCTWLFFIYSYKEKSSFIELRLLVSCRIETFIQSIDFQIYCLEIHPHRTVMLNFVDMWPVVQWLLFQVEKKEIVQANIATAILFHKKNCQAVAFHINPHHMLS